MKKRKENRQGPGGSRPTPTPTHPLCVRNNNDARTCMGCTEAEKRKNKKNPHGFFPSRVVLLPPLRNVRDLHADVVAGQLAAQPLQRPLV